MKADFTNLGDHVISIDRFQDKWRLVDDLYGKIADEHINQLKPLDVEASRFLWDYLSITNLHYDIPFKKDFFQTIDKAKVLDDNLQDVKKWLYHRGLPFEKEVILSWQPTDAMMMPWKLLIKYFDHFGSCDLTVFEQSLQWAILFYHEDEIYFGTKKEFKPSSEFNNYDFIW